MAALVSLVGWMFLPGAISTFLHNQLEHLMPANFAPAGTQNYARDRRRIYIAVVLSYLAYTLYTAYQAIEPNFYEILDVPLDVDVKGLRTRFRRLSAVYHPDKGGDETYFRLLRIAYDTLSSPTKKFAYDRFGKVVTDWDDKIKTLYEYMLYGFMVMWPYYAGTGILVIGLSWIQNATFGLYWRTLSLLWLATIHFVICTSNERLAIFRFLFPAKVQFEHAQLTQSFMIAVLIAISQVGPVLFPSTDASNEEVIKELNSISNALLAESTQALQIVNTPYPKDDPKTKDFHRQTAEWMSKQVIQSDPQYQKAFIEARDRILAAN